MKERLLGYLYYKWMLGSIFCGKDYIIHYAEENALFKEQFYDRDNLENIIKVLNGMLDVQIFDKDKLDCIRDIMKYYIDNNSNDIDIVELCNEIIELTKHPKGKNNKYFYKLQYEVRTGKKCPKLTPEIKREIDVQNIKDMKIFDDILKYCEGKDIDSYEESTDFLKSINLFVYECPEILFEEKIFDYIKFLTKYNSLSTENEELQQLNQTVSNKIDEFEKKFDLLNEQVLKQTIFSLLFTDNISSVIKEIKSEEEKELFLNSDTLSFLCELIQMNREKCMFDENIIENVREFLLLFRDEKIIDNKTLNEMKIELNVLFDENYHEKNRQFYINLYHKYGGKDTKYNLNFEMFKEDMNLLIKNTRYVILRIIDQELVTNKLSEAPNIMNYINYIINEYPLIRNNPIYMDVVEDIIYSNKTCLLNEKELDVESYDINLKLQKKIQKLRK